MFVKGHIPPLERCSFGSSSIIETVEKCTKQQSFISDQLAYVGFWICIYAVMEVLGVKFWIELTMSCAQRGRLSPILAQLLYSIVNLENLVGAAETI